MKTALKILRHMNVILAMMFGVFLVLDEYNPLMNFVDNDISHGLLALWCALAILTALLAWVVEEPVPARHRGRAARAWVETPDEHPPVDGWVR